MLIATVNNQQINLSTQSANSIESNNTQKRFRASSLSNDENDNNRYFINNDLNSNTKTIGRKGIYGSKELTNFKTGIVPFNIYRQSGHEEYACIFLASRSLNLLENQLLSLCTSLLLSFPSSQLPCFCSYHSVLP
jgi:hypothetical protein